MDDITIVRNKKELLGHYHQDFFGFNVYILYGGREELVTFSEKTICEGDFSFHKTGGDAKSVQFCNDGRMIYIISFYSDRCHIKNIIETIAHEALHICHWALLERGIKLSEETEEIFCYLLQQTVRNTVKILSKHKDFSQLNGLKRNKPKAIGKPRQDHSNILSRRKKRGAGMEDARPERKRRKQT